MEPLLGNDNFCCEQAMVILPPEQGRAMQRIWNKARMILVIVRRHCPKMLLDWLRSVETHLEKDMLLSRPATALPPRPSSKEKAKTHSKGCNLETWYKRERSTYHGMHSAAIGNTTRTVFICSHFKFSSCS